MDRSDVERQDVNVALTAESGAVKAVGSTSVRTAPVVVRTVPVIVPVAVSTPSTTLMSVIVATALVTPSTMGTTRLPDGCGAGLVASGVAVAARAAIGAPPRARIVAIAGTRNRRRMFVSF